MKTIFSLLVLFLTTLATAQQPTPQLEVTGNSKLEVSPDTGILNMTVSHHEMQFGESINGLNKKTEAIKAQLKKIGYSEKTIFTENFQVRKNTIYRHNKQIDSGYVATHQLRMEFINSVEHIRKILSQFAESATEFNLNFGFKLSEELQAKTQNKLIGLATKDAFQKAEVICAAAGTTLQKVIRIQYGNVNNTPIYQDRAMMNMKAEAMDVQGFTPSDQEFSTSIQVVWGID